MAQRLARKGLDRRQKPETPEELVAAFASAAASAPMQ